MAAMMSGRPDLSSEAAQRALQKLIFDEEQAIAAEIAAQQHQREAGLAAREQRQRADMNRCEARLKPLQPAYAERAAKLAALHAALADLVAFDWSLLAEEQRALAMVDATGVDGAEMLRRRIQMREAAGLPADRTAISLVAGADPAKRIALTCLLAILRGSIGDGVTWADTFNIT